MKLLIATGIYPPSIGGPATYSELLFNELPKKGIDVEIQSFDSVRHLPKGIAHLAYFFRIISAARFCDVVYALDPVSVGFPSQLAAQLFCKPFYLRLGGDYAWEQGVQRFGVTDDLDTFAAKQIGYAFPVTVLKKIQSHVAWWSRKIIVPSEYLKKVVMSWGIRPEKVVVIKNTTEALPALTSKDELRAKWNVTQPTLVSIGRLVPWKGFRELIEILPELLKHHPTAKLVIIGDGPQHDELETKITELKLEKAAELKGRMKRDELLSFLKAADVFVLNTSYEGFSHQVVEAQAIGTPVVTTTAGGNAEAVRNGYDGLLVAPHQSEVLEKTIEALLNDPVHQKRLSENGLKTVAEWSVDQMLDTLISELTQ